MIKRTIHISKPSKLSLSQEQMKVRLQDATEKWVEKTVPIEDIGIVILENPQISMTHGLMAALLANNVALVTSDSKFHPTGMLLNLAGNTTQAESFRHQSAASLPLKKQLWQQVVKQKLLNQAHVLSEFGVVANVVLEAAKNVRSGDPDNREGFAAAYYWPRLFDAYPGFTRGRDAGYPNNLLNYGYAILRATMARSLVGSGLHPTHGIFHHNRYNHYCLADDMMEPYRPFIDRLLADMVEELNEGNEFLTKEQKVMLLKIPTLDVNIGGKRRPLMVACSETSSSLVKCFASNTRNLALPSMN